MINRRITELARLLYPAAALSDMCGGPYAGADLRAPKGGKRPGTPVRCHVCGAGGGRTTLYSDGDAKICARCRARMDGLETGDEADEEQAE